ncbi:MAG: cadmium-translocating P-type ATPase [Saccharofermentans sp.]|nr:cadmium-translocating P-type ATPase [Saccharofermentans sp.]
MKKYLNKKQRKWLLRIVIAIFLLIAAVIVNKVFDPVWYIALPVFMVPYLVCGYDVIKCAAVNIIHGQVFDEKFLMAIATIGAFATGEYPEAVAVMLFYQIGELFQSIAVGRSRKSIAGLMDIRPDYANLLTGEDGQEEQMVSPEEVEIGSTILVKPGEKIPLDGVIIDGNTTVNTAALTGESAPVDLGVSDNVISGTLNLTGVIRVRTTSSYTESTVAKILELVENSYDKKAKVENFITRFARWYTPCVVIAALLLFVVPPLIINPSSWDVWSAWLNRAMVFLVVSCPCALVVSVPLSFFGGLGGASREGVLIKGANYLEALSNIDTVVFDKTGTITEGRFAVDDIHPDEISKAELLDIAACCESYSGHPVAESVIREHEGHIDKSRVDEVEEIAGKGIRAVVDGETYYCGNGALMDMVHAKWHDCHLTGTIIHISREGEYLGHIVINDKIKDDSADAMKALKDVGIRKTVMLTGDKSKVAESVAKQVGITEYYAELLPQDKVAKVEELINAGNKLAFAGDGINDAPVLTRADVGIAMGAMGSDAAIESADVVLMDDNLGKIAVAVRISRRTMTIVRENIVFALGVKVLILILGALGIAGMWLAVFGDVGVLVIAILNAMRAMMKIRE